MAGRGGWTRREWLERVGRAAGGALVLRGLPGCDGSGAASDGDAAGAAAEPDAGAPARVPGLAPLRGDGSHVFDYVDTLVVVQMENRSFDHVFGSLSLVEGRKDVEGLTPGMANPSATGDLVGIEPMAGRFVVDPDPPHNHKKCLVQWNGGANDGFVQAWEDNVGFDPARKGLVMGYHVRDELPVSYALADAFTLCDRWHCSLLGPTWPNRFYSHAATSEGLLSNSEPISAPTPYRALLESGRTFRVYHAAPIWFLLTMTDLEFEEQNDRDLDGFFADAAAGTLPNVSIVEPFFGQNDDHPPQDVRAGQAFLASVYEALRQSPQWDRTLLLVFYDEHGGFFDHVPPPLAKGEPLAAADPDGFSRLGFRVPALAAGGLVRRGAVFSETVDHASVPALVSNLFGLPHVNDRSAMAGDLGAVLSLDLVPHSARPDPPPAPKVELSIDALDRQLRDPALAHYGQPELVRHALALGLDALPSLRRRRQAIERWLDRGLRLGAFDVP